MFTKELIKIGKTHSNRSPHKIEKLPIKPVTCLCSDWTGRYRTDLFSCHAVHGDIDPSDPSLPLLPPPSPPSQPPEESPNIPTGGAAVLR